MPAAPGEIEPPIPSESFIAAVTGQPEGTAIPLTAFERARHELNANALREEDDAAQIIELSLIRETADRIEASFTERKMELPTVFILYTAGFDVPDDVLDATVYGTGALEYLPKADIGGHLGVAGAVKLDDQHTAMVLNGRAHPYSGVGRRYAEMIYSRPLNVIKELARRQRERGIQCAVVATYLTGVDETSHDLRKGSLGVVTDHTELGGGRSELSAGAGPRNYLDTFLGERFQPKLGRASDILLAKRFMDEAKHKGVKVGAAAALGTPGATSYQSLLDRGIGLAGFERLKQEHDVLAQEVFGKGAEASLFFDMALTFEADALRQTIVRRHTDGMQEYTEQDIPMLLLVLPTDVAGEDSAKVNHALVVQQAKENGKRNGELIREFISRLVWVLPMDYPLHSIPEWADKRFSLASLLPQE